MDVGILGATGVVGQQIMRLLATHPWFSPVWLAGSDRSTSLTYGEATGHKVSHLLPADISQLVVQRPEPEGAPRLVFSALDASVAGEIEAAFARAGHFVVSNTRNYRMEADVPLVIPEINPSHLRLLSRQAERRGWRGGIVTNPNCSAIVLTMGLAAIEPFGLRSIVVTTLQAVSGAGYPGVASLDILGNVIPYIGGEEEKIERETRKILGAVADGEVTPHPVVVSAQTTRVPVVDGHTMTVAVALDTRPTIDDVREAFASFRGRASDRDLPSAPARPIVLLDAVDRPQPALDAATGGGMSVSVGRVRACPVHGYKFVTLGHNTIRGAAGAAILNAELLVADGWLS